MANLSTALSTLSGVQEEVSTPAYDPLPPAALPGPVGPILCSTPPSTGAAADCEQFLGIEAGDLDLRSIGRSARGSLPPLSVAMIDQQNYTSCGEAAFAMGWNFLHPNLVQEVPRIEAVGLKIGAYFPAQHPGPGGYVGTSPKGMQSIGEFFAEQYKVLEPVVGNIDLREGDPAAQLEAKGLLYSQLSTGHPVIIEVTDVIGDPSTTLNDSHYVIITGMDFDNEKVTYNDPYTNLSSSGKYSGYARVASWEAVWASWSRNRDHNPGSSERIGRGWYMIPH